MDFDIALSNLRSPPSLSLAIRNVFLFFFLQMSYYGLISLGDSFDSHKAKPFSAALMFEGALIAPLWYSFAYNGRGRLFYRVSKIPSDLEIIANLIANASSENDYRPTLAVIATWENLPSFSSRVSIIPRRVASFQGGGTYIEFVL